MTKLMRGLPVIALTGILGLGLVSAEADAQWRGNSAGKLVGNVYVMTNSEEGNEVVTFRRFSNGRLRQVNRQVETGGLGGNNAVGVDPLGSQNSLLLSNDDRYLFAVNAGSNEVTSFHVSRRGRLRFADKVHSGGTSPVSLAMDGDDRLLVLNSRGTGSIATFTVGKKGRLKPVGKPFDLGLSEANTAGMNVSPGQIILDALNRRVVITNGFSSSLSTFSLNDDGVVEAVDETLSLDTGLAFTVALTRFGHALVTQAGNTDGSTDFFGSAALSSVDLNTGGPLYNISGSVGNDQSATCWVVTDGERFAFTTSTFSDTISSYEFDRSGELELVAGVAAETNDGPIDLGLTDDGNFLYVLNAGNGQDTPEDPNNLVDDVPGGNISGYWVDRDSGELTRIGSFGDLPAGASIQGIAIR